MDTDYFLSTGEIDRKRLIILSKLYNPPAIALDASTRSVHAVHENGETSTATTPQIQV